MLSQDTLDRLLDRYRGAPQLDHVAHRRAAEAEGRERVRVARELSGPDRMTVKNALFAYRYGFTNTNKEDQ